MVEAEEQQTIAVAKAVETREEDHWILDTILALAVIFILPTALLPVLALPVAWQPPSQVPLPWYPCLGPAPLLIQTPHGPTVAYSGECRSR